MKTPSRLIIIGSTGRMGRTLVDLAPAAGFTVVARVSREENSLADVEAKNSDVVIDFSLPEFTPQVVKWCVENRKPLVSGVTGLSSSDLQTFQKAGTEIPVLWAPNMSLGVAVLKRALKQLGSLGEFDFQIEEVHHRHKKDAPSGTAKALQETLEETLGRPLPQPISIRGGGVFGIHKISAFGDEEVLSFEHTALSRSVFAKGALRAAGWLITQRPGFYGLDDTL